MIIITNKSEWTSHQTRSKNESKAVRPWTVLEVLGSLSQLAELTEVPEYLLGTAAASGGLHSDLVRALPHDRTLF